MKGALAVLAGFLLLPGSVVLLLAANFGALKGYLIGAISFFGFLLMLAIIWTFGLPGTPALTGPQGPLPSFKLISADSPDAQRFSSLSRFTGGEGGGWQPAPAPTGSDKELSEELTAAEQAAVTAFIEEYNRDVKQSSKEADVVNLQPRTFYTTEDGTTVAATVISPKRPPAGSGLERPTFQPVTEFSYRDPGFPNLYNYAFLLGSLLLLVLHILLLARAERRNPLGPVSEPAAERQPAASGAASGARARV
jgi:hypothetical protein